MKYNPGDKVIISATVKASDDCGEMILVEANSGEFYIDESDIAPNVDEHPFYKKGLDDAWQIIQKLNNRNFDGAVISGEDMIDIFGTNDIVKIVMKFTASEVAKKIAEWKEKEIINIGDIVETIWDRGIVTYISDNGMYNVLFNDGVCGGEFRRGLLTKTGEHIDIKSFLKGIGKKSR